MLGRLPSAVRQDFQDRGPRPRLVPDARRTRNAVDPETLPIAAHETLTPRIDRLCHRIAKESHDNAPKSVHLQHVDICTQDRSIVSPASRSRHDSFAAPRHAAARTASVTQHATLLPSMRLTLGRCSPPRTRAVLLTPARSSLGDSDRSAAMRETEQPSRATRPRSAGGRVQRRGAPRSPTRSGIVQFGQPSSWAAPLAATASVPSKR